MRMRFAFVVGWCGAVAVHDRCRNTECYMVERCVCYDVAFSLKCSCICKRYMLGHFFLVFCDIILPSYHSHFDYQIRLCWTFNINSALRFSLLKANKRHYIFYISNVHIRNAKIANNGIGCNAKSQNQHTTRREHRSISQRVREAAKSKKVFIVLSMALFIFPSA